MIDQIKITLQNFFKEYFIYDFLIWEQEQNLYKFSMKCCLAKTNSPLYISGAIINYYITFDQNSYRKYENELSRLLKLTSFL